MAPCGWPAGALLESAERESERNSEAAHVLAYDLARPEGRRWPVTPCVANDSGLGGGRIVTSVLVALVLSHPVP